MPGFSLIWITKLLACVENIELWWIMGKQKFFGWKSTHGLAKIDSSIPIG